jgi:hypothetical protein
LREGRGRQRAGKQRTPCDHSVRPMISRMISDEPP